MNFSIKEFLIDTFDFIRQNPAISYSLLLIVVLPLVLYYNTTSIINRLGDDGAVGQSINDQAAINRDLLTMMLLPAFPGKDSLDQEKLQRIVDSVATYGNDPAGTDGATTTAADEGTKLENIRVIVRDDYIFKAVAAQDPQKVGKAINTDPSLNGENLIALAWASAKKDYGAQIEEAGKKYFRIANPLRDPATGEVYAVVTADISTDKIMTQISATIIQAYIILVIAILLSLFLVFQHTRLFSYVGLSKKLLAQNKAKDDFIRMATHELRAPVTIMNMYTETLKEELAPVVNKDQKEYIERVLMSIHNLRDLMSDILEVSHIQQGRTDFKPDKIQPATIIKEIVNGIRPKAVEKGLSLVFEGEDFPHYINVNEVCFKRIITNLVENSVKYTPAGKVTVSIKAETAKKRGVITVQDTGLGISAEGQAHLFEQFYRVKTQDTESIPGTGLGLWMSREMARRMGGDIMLESIEHMGSRFFVWFPLADK
ncbi:MAG: HAMP domain-containing histidine kinase [Candidatus Pacebacteria bacterium]|jgi:signal transduction histidine kinase|nr:HAMP domain-containing histidine kinase [Candidatus Paceibacterota bacterium]